MESTESETSLEEEAKKLMENGEFENSIKVYEEILETKDDADTWNNLGTLYVNNDNSTKAIECFNKALELNPNHYVALNNLGVTYVQEGEFKEAIPNFQKALSIKPENAPIWENLAECYERIGDFFEANTCRMNAKRIKS